MILHSQCHVYITRDDLVPVGLTFEDLPRLAPWAVKYVGLDGQPCWCAEDLLALLMDEGAGGAS